MDSISSPVCSGAGTSARHDPPRQGLPHSLEVVVCLAALGVVSPLLLVIAAFVASTSRGPVLFRHERLGRDGRPFALLKFRTMRVCNEGPEVTAAGDKRVTAIGRLLRKTKLDELPQLWNVVRGDMSLVGPRPEAIRYTAVEDAAWADVLGVRPGVTDPVTLRLRNEEDLLAAAGGDPETFYRRYLLPYKLRGYRQYLASRTWTSDVFVLWLTVVAIIFPRHIPTPSPAEIIATVLSPAGAPRPFHPDGEDV